jgi:hypothetical protein
MKPKLIFVCILISVCLISCEKAEKENPINSGKSYLKIHLTDAPADYDAVLVDVQDVLINQTYDDQGWMSLENVETGIYNLLDFTGGVDTLIASSEVDTGIIAQIRLILGSENFLITLGDTIPLNTPSAQQSGLKIKINQNIDAGINYKLVLDFDASRSVVKAGNSGKYILKPVIRAVFEAQDGGIEGAIADSIDAVVYALQESDTIAGSYANTSGHFKLLGLEEGIYSVSIIPETGWNDTLLPDIQVTTGNITNMGFIELTQSE